MATALRGQPFEWGAATLAAPGESECGDHYVVEPHDQGATVALIDALGHGRDAALAARVAAQSLSLHHRESPIRMIERCHAELRGTRGAAVSVAVLDAPRRTLTWLGIGNVAGALLSANPRAQPRVAVLLNQGGVVGYRLPELNASVLTLAVDDTLILTTDGVGEYAHDRLPAPAEPQRLAEHIVGRFAKHTDDAAAVVVRLHGDWQ